LIYESFTSQFGDLCVRSERLRITDLEWASVSVEEAPLQRLLDSTRAENKYQAVSQGARPFGKRSILASM